MVQCWDQNGHCTTLVRCVSLWEKQGFDFHRQEGLALNRFGHFPTAFFHNFRSWSFYWKTAFISGQFTPHFRRIDHTMFFRKVLCSRKSVAQEPAPNCTTPSWPLAGRVQAALRREVGIFVTFSFIALLLLSPLWTSDAALVPQLLAISSTNFQSVTWLGGLAGLVATRSAVKIQDLVEDGTAPGWFSRNFSRVGWEVGS